MNTLNHQMKDNNIYYIPSLSKEYALALLLILMMLINYPISNTFYSLIVLLLAVYVAIICKSVYLLVPCLLADALQGCFMINTSLSFNRVLALLYIVSYLFQHKFRLKLKKFDLLLIFFVLYHVASSFWSISGDISSPVAFMISIVMLICMRGENTNQFDDVLRLMLIAAYLFGIELFFFTITSHGGIASQIVFDSSMNANTISSAVALMGCIVFGRICSSFEMNRMIGYGFIGVCTITILIVGSRTSLVAMFISFIVTFFISNKMRGECFSIKTLGILLLSSVVIFVALYFIMKQNTEIFNRFTFSNANRKDVSSIRQRVLVWEALITHIIPNNFLFGVGFGLLNVKAAVEPYVPIAKHAHNMFLAILSETGVLGLVQYLIIFIMSIRTLFKANNVYFSMILSIISFAFFRGIGEEMINQRWLWLAIGLIFVSTNAANNGRRKMNDENN